MTHIWQDGNSAKQYCLDWIARKIQARSGEVTLLDIGCGSGGSALRLLDAYPQIRYVGVEPMKRDYDQAVVTLRGRSAEVHHAPGYDLYRKLGRKFDFVLSFSTMEYVYRR